MGRPRSPLDGTFVLLVEDDEDSRDFLKTMLEYYGAAVSSVQSVDEACRVLQNVRPDVVITDIGLRQKPGTWLLEEVRGSPRLIGLPVIAVTGRVVPPTLKKMFSGFLEKPVDVEQLCATILRLLRREAAG
jgi:CheY-like chemotaxis protein